MRQLFLIISSQITVNNRNILRILRIYPIWALNFKSILVIFLMGYNLLSYPLSYIDSGGCPPSRLLTKLVEYGVDLISPIPVDGQWQSKAAKGYGIANFKVDWNKKLVRCPKGKVSRKWIPTHNTYQQPVISVKFDKADCLVCESRADCTRALSRSKNSYFTPSSPT